MKSIEKQGIKPDILSSVSAGAIVGALYADGYTPDEIAYLFEDISFRHMTKIRIPDGGFFKTDIFQDFLSKKLQSKTFEELSIPLRGVATDLDKGQSTTFSSGIYSILLLLPVVSLCYLVPKRFMASLC